MPKPEDIDITDLDLDMDTLRELLTVDKEVWLKDVENQKEYFAQFGDRLPKEIAEELKKLVNTAKKQRICNMPDDIMSVSMTKSMRYLLCEQTILR